MAIKLNGKRKAKLFSELIVGKNKETIANRFSGVTCELEPEAVALYDFIIGAERFGDCKGMALAIDIFRDNWPEEYMTLLD